MNLTPREKDKLLISMAAMVARRRLERGVKLNHPEAIALISDFVVEGARDGRPGRGADGSRCPRDRAPPGDGRRCRDDPRRAGRSDVSRTERSSSPCTNRSAEMRQCWSSDPTANAATRTCRPIAAEAMICTFECTFCADCVGDRALRGVCPNCGGELVRRPVRPAAMLAKYPASTKRVLKAEGCVPVKAA